MKLTISKSEFNRCKTDDDAIRLLEKKRWNGKPICPTCGSKGNDVTPKPQPPSQVGEPMSKHRYFCNKCNRANKGSDSYNNPIFNVFNGTSFKYSTLNPLRKLKVLYILINATEGISGNQFAEMMDMDIVSAWKLMNRFIDIKFKVLEKHKKFVYVIRLDLKEDRGWYKVGITDDIERRLKDFRLAVLIDIHKPEYKIKTPYFGEIERMVHNKFTNDGEWVKADLNDIINTIEDYKHDHSKCPSRSELNRSRVFKFTATTDLQFTARELES